VKKGNQYTNIFKKWARREAGNQNHPPYHTYKQTPSSPCTHKKTVDANETLTSVNPKQRWHSGDNAIQPTQYEMNLMEFEQVFCARPKLLIRNSLYLMNDRFQRHDTQG